MRFARITDLTVVILPIDLTGAESDAVLRSRLVHPECVEFAGSPECGESLDAHLAELEGRPGIHWHRCAFGRQCGFVPVVWKGCCLATCKLVLPGSKSDEAFEHNLELLHVLVENFLACEAGVVTQLAPETDGDAAPAGAVGMIDDREVRQRATHPRVREAIDYVDRHLADPKMNVASVAAALDMNAAYLAHLFAEHTGTRFSRYIASRRIELAKQLLATSNRQIKLVAFESGHANSDWFSQVFRAHTGMTARQFRRKARLG